jgi:hypothetical protein
LSKRFACCSKEEDHNLCFLILCLILPQFAFQFALAGMDSKIEVIETKIAKLEEEIENITRSLQTATASTEKSELIKLLTAMRNDLAAMRNKENILLQLRQGGHVVKAACSHGNILNPYP